MKNFDENIRKKLSDAEMPVSEGMWASIESQLPEKKERPKVWLLFLLAAFTIPFALYFASSNGIKSTEIDTVAQRTSTADSPITITSQEATSQSDLALNNNASGGKVNESIQGNLKNQIKDNEFRDSKLNPASTTNTSEVRSRSTVATGQEEPAYIGIQNADLNKSSSDKRTLKTSLQSAINSSDRKQSSIPFNNLSNSSKKIKFLRDPLKKIDIKKSDKGQLKLVETSRISQKKEQLSPFKSINKNRGQFCQVNETVRLRTIGYRMVPVKMSVAACPTFDVEASGYYAFGEYFVGLPIQKLKAEGDEIPELISTRNNTESSSISNSFTLGIGKTWESGLLVEVGLNYDMIRMSYDPPNDSGVITTIIDKETGQIIRIDTSYQNEVITNKFDLLNIPLAIGYNLHLRDKWSVTAKAGILLNVLSSNSGAIFDGEGDSHVYSSDDIGKSLFKTNLDANYFSSISITREITSDLSLGLGLRAQFYPSNFSISGYGVEQRYQKYGFNLGLTHRI